PQMPNGDCGDDGIAVRNFAGATGANLIRNADVRGALDKGIKVSDGAVALVERSLIEHNADGGLQATLGGNVTATENISRSNRGTFSANGIAANGAAIDSSKPAHLTTRGNLSLDNALRGLSVRALSVAQLADDFACGNGTEGRGGAGLSILNGAGQGSVTAVHGFAAVHNLAAGATLSDTSIASFGTDAAPGANAFAFNGTGNSNLRNLTTRPLSAVGNQWEHCGERVPCNTAAVLALDVSTTSAAAPVAVTPALATRQHRAPIITAITPPFAASGELVRIYGSGFDAIGGAGTACDRVADANTCRPVRGNCVMIDRQPAAVIAATPTMLVVRAPFTCVAPVPVAARTRWSRGFGRATFCTVPATP
ncbi:MAG: right-handed parallel beta-helix repeat-containing protein, partial [bacterium]